MHLKLVFFATKDTLERIIKEFKNFIKRFIFYIITAGTFPPLFLELHLALLVFIFNGNHLLEYIIEKKISLISLLSWVDWVIVFNLWTYLRHLFVNLFLHVWFLRQYPHNAPIFHAFPKCDIRNFLCIQYFNIKSTKKVGK